jgi:hypothetical protein
MERAEGIVQCFRIFDENSDFSSKNRESRPVGNLAQAAQGAGSADDQPLVTGFDQMKAPFAHLKNKPCLTDFAANPAPITPDNPTFRNCLCCE